MTPLHKLRLFPRLALAFLLVIVVFAISLVIFALFFAPLFLRDHLHAMELTSHNMPVGTDSMLGDLQHAYLSAMSQSLLGATLISVILAGLLSTFISLQITRPLNHMQSLGRRIANGEYSVRLVSQGPGEVGELAKDLNALATALQAAESQRQDLIRNLSHELRTPLTNLRGYLEGLREGIFDPEDTLKASRRQLEQLEHLLDDMFLLSRVDAKQTHINLADVNIRELCQSTVESVQPLFDEKEVSLHLADIPVTYARIDPGRTRQVLAILLDNALRHSSAGNKVSLWIETVTNDSLSIHVRDTGEGIPKEALPLIFERFYQVDSARQAGSSGLGLTIAKHFVEMQGGTLQVESKPGYGSHFWFNVARSA